MRFITSWLTVLALNFLGTLVLPAADFYTSYWGPAPTPPVLGFGSVTSWIVGSDGVRASRVPGPGDIVHITTSASADIIQVGILDIQAPFIYNQTTADQVIVSGSVVTLGSNLITPSLRIIGGEAIVNEARTVTTFEISDGTLNGSGSLKVTGSGSLLGGTLTGAGLLDFSASSVVAINTSNPIKSLILNSLRHIRFTGSTTLSNDAYGGGLFMSDSAEIEIGGTLTTTQANARIEATGLGAGRHIIVNGNLIADSTAGTTINVPLQVGSMGSITVNSGRVLNAVGGDSAGNINLLGNGTLDYYAGTFTQANTTTYTGTGTLRHSGGTTTVLGGGQAFAGTIELKGGIFNLAGSTKTAAFKLTGGTLGGSGILHVTSTGSWLNEGTLTGSGSLLFEPNSDATINTANPVRTIIVNSFREVLFLGSATLTTDASAGGLQLADAALLEVCAGGILTTTGAACIWATGGSTGRHILVNGSLITDATTTLSIPLQITATGTVTVANSTFTTTTTTNRGIMDIHSGATWAFSPSDVSFIENGVARGTGTLKPSATWALDQIRLDPGQTSAITGTLNIAGAVSGRIPALPILVNGSLADRLAITGSIGAAPVDLAFTVGTAPTEASYTIVSWTSGSTVPTIGTVTGRPAGYALAVDSVNRAIVLKADPVQGFVTRFYSQVLNRTPDAAGLDDWTAQLNAGTRTGASLAYGFVFSQEFLSRNQTNETFVDTLYSAFFNRAADAGGKAGWLAQLNGGALREDVLNGFLFAPEFNNLCASYGITKYSAADAQKKQIREFTRRFYQQCLSREPDAGGASDWANQLIAGTRTGATLAEGFVGSQEFIGRGLTDDQFLFIMYKAFFDRDGDAGGLATWKAELAAGKTRLQVVAGFTHAQEFINLCANYGITPFSAGG